MQRHVALLYLITGSPSISSLAISLNTINYNYYQYTWAPTNCMHPLCMFRTQTRLHLNKMQCTKDASAPSIGRIEIATDHCGACSTHTHTHNTPAATNAFLLGISWASFYIRIYNKINAFTTFGRRCGGRRCRILSRRT